MYNNLTKISGDFNTTEKAKEYSLNPQWQDYFSLWDFVSGATDGIGKIVFEHIANFVQNIRDIDACGLHQLYSIARELDVEQIFSYDLAYPVDLEEIMNTLSTNRSFTLTTGYILHNDTLKSIYTDLGVNVTGGVSGELSASVIWDGDYITGFVEPYLSAHLALNANLPLTGSQSGTALDYQGFMDDISNNPETEYSSSTSAELITEATHKLRNIIIRASYQRDTLKNIVKKHAMIGTNTAIEKIIGEYLLRSFTKKEDWRLFVEVSGANKPDTVNAAYRYEQVLPSIKDINSYFDVEVIEYWDNTEYMNISAESPYLCGITGYTVTSATTSQIDVSGNLVTGTVTANTPVYGVGLCGYVVTGGNPRFWEGDNLSDAILLSEHTSAEVSAFYNQIGLTGTFADTWNLQTTLWDTYATSGLNRLAVIPDLTGTRTPAYSATPPSAVPASGYTVQPTSLSAMHWKYMGTVSGDMPPANYKNQIYPTIAPQPFIWNLVEKVFDEYPDILRSLLPTDQTATGYLANQIDASGNLIDSWHYYNQEYIGYQTFYEQSNNLDFNEQENEDIDRDGPWGADALSAYLVNPSPSAMLPYYTHISKEFSTSGLTEQITGQLVQFESDIKSLSGKRVYQFAYDQEDYQYTLFKEGEKLNDFGEIYMRYTSHPLSFPLSYGTSSDYKLQQLYIRGGMGIGLDTVLNGRCYDFGFYGDVMWVYGRADDGNDRLYLMHTAWVDFPATTTTGPNNETWYAVVVDGSDVPRTLDIPINNFVGHYNYNDYIIFVYVTNWSTPDINGQQTVTLKFRHYNRYTREFETTTLEDVSISGLEPQYTPVDDSNVWRLAASEDLIHLAYESINSVGGDYVNSITTIDITKNTLSDTPGDYTVNEWRYFLDNF